MLRSLRHFIPLAALIALASVMAFAPKIGPIVLACAVLAAILASLDPVRRHGWREGISTWRAAIADCGSAKNPLIVIILFMALCALSLLWVAEANFAMSRTIRLIGFFLAVSLYGLMFTQAGGAQQRLIQPMARLATAGFGLAAVCLAISFIFVVPAKASPDAFVNRSVVILSLSCFAFAAYIFSTSWSQAVKGGLTGVLIVVALGFSLSSNSQTSSVALICGVIAVLVFKPASAALRRLFVVAIAGLCFAMPLLIKAAISLPQTVFASSFFQQGSAAQRLRIWDSYLALVREKPLLGWGVEGSRDFDAELLSLPVTATQNTYFSSHPHNALLQIWTDLGLVGALLFCILIAMLGLRIEKARPEARAPIYGLFVGILATSAVSHGAFQSWWLASVAILAVSVFPLADSDKPYS